jgi:hypothetical protein
VTATTPGARFYFNVIRKGSEASDEAVSDLMSGAPLGFEIVDGAHARANGHPSADLDANYIKVHLPRPVPRDGEVRLLIEKTYEDPKSYFREGDTIVFSRSLGIKRNAVVLPAGYELVACNVPSQVLSEADGRVRISFMNTYPDAAGLVIKGRPLGGTSTAARTEDGSAATGRAAAQPVPTGPAIADEASRLSERAHQDREIVYFLQPPETHAFSLYHDYTETRDGVDKYLNVVRRGSAVSNPSARILDTGEALKVEALEGDAIARAGLDIGEPVRPDTEVVVVRFPPVKKGQSLRLRIEETYTDPGRYGIRGGELVWHRSFGRPRNAIVLPAGWSVTASSIPAVVSETADGRIRLDYDNPRPDSIDVLLKARRR